MSGAGRIPDSSTSNRRGPPGIDPLRASLTALVALAASFIGAHSLIASSTAASTRDAAPAASTKPVAPVDPAPALFDRVGMIGASATAGFGMHLDALGVDGVSKEIHGADLGDIFHAACRRPVILSRFASIFFFRDPLGTGSGAVDRILRFEPTCVIAVDFLFWYGYGSINAHGGLLRNEDERLELLDVGLAQLDRVVRTGVPVVVGDFPDMHESVGRMLRAKQMPANETLGRLNARLAEWVSSRPNVRVLELSTLAPSLLRGDELEIRGRVWCKAKDGELIQRDRLHPTFVGAMAMMAKSCELVEAIHAEQVRRRSEAALQASPVGIGAGAPPGEPPAESSPIAAPTTVTICDETLCFEPEKVTARFLEQVRAGRRRSDESR